MKTIDITNTPRYKASFPVQPVFVTNADKCGDQVFTQVKREGNVAVYRRDSVETGRTVGYETVVIKIVKAGTIFSKDSKPIENDYESYPGSAAFGRTAWFYNDETAALNKLENIVNSNRPKPLQVPKGQFTFIQFAEINGLPVNQETAETIQKLLVNKVISFKGNLDLNGKKVQIFAGV